MHLYFKLFILCAWIFQYSSAYLSIAPPDGQSAAFKRRVQLIEFAYESKCKSVRRERHFDQQDTAIFHAVEDVLSQQLQQYKWLQQSRGDEYAIPLRVTSLSRGFWRQTTIILHPKNQREYDDIKSKKSELQEGLIQQLNRIFEKDLLDRYEHLRLTTPPQNPTGSFAYKLTLADPNNDESHHLSFMGGTDMASSAQFFIWKSVVVALRKEGLRRGIDSSYDITSQDSTLKVSVSYQSRDLNRVKRVVEVAKEATKAASEEHKWFTVSFNDYL